MEKIVSVAGFMLTSAIDKLSLNKCLTPMFIGYKKDLKEIKKTIKGLSLEESIPKAISIFENNTEDVECGAIIFPAEIDAGGKRESIIMVMVQKYKCSEYITISLPYSIKDGKIEVKEYELIDYSPFLIEKLPELEKSFVNGLLSYQDAKEIWNR